jgi:cation diffusion facilitator CzcD-associated flavoprotein CzcO
VAAARDERRAPWRGDGRPAIPSAPRDPRPVRVAIVGAGFSGLCLGIALRRAGIESFEILEKADGVGGTWRANTYPGAACDSPAFAYCFSFEQKTDWSRKWAPQPEILAYLEHCARKYGLVPHLRLRTEVAGARFDAARAVWRVRTTAGEVVEAEVLVSGVGQLSRPRVPDLPGLERFRGGSFHSARWDPACSLAGRRVAVIGNAASAIQLVPPVAREAEQLTVFQRSANWMIPKRDRAYAEAERRRFARHAWLAWLYRAWLWGSFEARFPVFRGARWLGRRVERIALRHLRAAVRDPALRGALVPDYPIGGKRILISDDYYEALVRPNVRLVTSAIDRVEEDAIVTCDGERHPADVLVLATGFETTEFLAPMEIEGLRGLSLREAWRGGARAYLGISVPGFPNFFLMYGPNTNLGHNSIPFMLECQAGYVVRCIRELSRRGLRWLDLRPEVLEAWDARIQAELARTVWAETDHSWYKDARGRITNNWSGTTARYWWSTRRPDLGAYHLEAAEPATRTAVAREPVRASGTPS